MKGLKVLHITTSYKGGAGIAALRLHEALRAQGVASAYISRGKSIGFDGAPFKDTFFDYQPPSFLGKVKTKLVPTPFEKLRKKLQNDKGAIDCETYSLPFSALRLENHPLVKEATLLHLHWISDIVDYPSFFKTIHIPIVWTLHDMNPFMGLFHYEQDAEQNQAYSSIASEMLSLKKSALSTVGQGAVVSPSTWLLDKAIESGVFASFQVKKVIANGVDLKTFAISEGENIRAQYGIAADEKVLLFVAGALTVKRKGFDLLLEALANITVPVTLLTMGKGLVKTKNKYVKIVPLGFLDSEVKIAEAYNAADLFVLPSREDNLPNTMLESLATGTPVLSFDIGGMQQHVRGDNGERVNCYNVAEFSKAISSFLKSEENKSKEVIRTYAQSHFSFKLQAKSYIEVYTSLVSNS